MHCGVLGWGRSISQCENTLDHSAPFVIVLVILDEWACANLVGREKSSQCLTVFVLTNFLLIFQTSSTVLRSRVIIYARIA